ncbi:MAG: tetratricopeptide repeat protein [Promethearchaeota archaeon]|jgi:lipopolysaccharide biosynthesis regulator YciM
MNMQPSISFEVWVIILLFGAILVISFYSVYTRKKVKRDEDNPYILALKFMAEGENRLAVEKFKEAVRHNSNNIDAYLKLGTILRNEGLYKNAIRIHQDLTLRGNLDSAELIDVKKNLILDYWYLKDYTKAEYYLNQLKEDKNLIDWATPYLIKILEKKGEWQQAIDVLNKSSLSREQKGKFKIANLKVKQGKKLAENQEEKESRILFKEAIKTDHECAQGYLELGDSYLREGRTDDAINAWTDLCKKVKDKAHLAFDRLEKAWFEKGHFSKIEDLYTSMLQEDEDNLPALIALSEIYRKKGELDQSLKLLQDAQKKDLDSNLIQSQMAKVHMDKNQYKEAATLALDLLAQDNQI